LPEPRLEALQTAVAEAFSPVHRPAPPASRRAARQSRSLALLARLGFVDEGLARDELCIDGAWRDHQPLAITNPAFITTAGW